MIPPEPENFVSLQSETDIERTLQKIINNIFKLFHDLKIFSCSEKRTIPKYSLVTIFQNFHALGNIFKTANSYPPTGRNYSGHSNCEIY